MPNDTNRSSSGGDTIRMDAVSTPQTKQSSKARSGPQLTDAQREAAMRARRAQQQNRAQLEQQAQARASQEMQRKQLQAQKKKEAEDARAMKAYRENQARQEAEKQARLEAEERARLEAEEQARLKAEAEEQKKRAKKEKKSGGFFKKKDKKSKKQNDAVVADTPKEEKPKKKNRALGCLGWILLVFIVIGVAFGAFWIFRSHQSVTPIDEVAASERAAVAAERETQNVYMVLAGTDARESDEAARSDTIIYAVFRQADRKIEMVSIPRDTLVEINGEGAKINSALAYGGMDLLVNTVENFLDTPIDHTMLVDFSSFEEIVDAMGGITIDVAEDMYLPEENIDLKAGTQTLNGYDALAFVRWRGDGTGDLGRIERQKQFMNAMIEKMTHLNPIAAVRTALVIKDQIETDMSFGEMLGLAWSFIGMSGDDLEYQSFEVDATYINGVSFVIISDDEINRVVQTMRYGTVLDGLTDSSDTTDYTYSTDTYSYDNSSYDDSTNNYSYDNNYYGSNTGYDSGGGYDNGGYDNGGGYENTDYGGTPDGGPGGDTGFEEGGPA